MDTLTRRLRFAAVVGLVILLGCGSGPGVSNSSPDKGNPSTFRISGAITVGAGVAVNLTGAATRSTTTDANGNYVFGSLANGGYTLTPSKPGYTFDPLSVGIVVNGGDVTGQNFTATAIPPTYSISGAVSGAIADGVLITLGGAMDATTTTTGGGLYAFSRLANGNYTLTPSASSGYIFDPPSMAVTVSGGDVTVFDFVSSCPTAWTSVASGTTGNLSGVWGGGPNDVWAVGWRGTILHWNGSASSSVASGTTANLSGLWGSGPNDLWAVGSTILHWNGTAWSSVASPKNAFFLNVWGSGPNDVWAVGGSDDDDCRSDGTILHWNGSAWTAVSSDATDLLTGVWGSRANDVWAVGSGGIVHWDGSAWTSVPSGTTDFLTGVWGSGANDVWAVGGGGTILHWDGSAWTSVPSGTTDDLNSVWGSGANDVWAVGGGGTIVHWDGSAWTSASSCARNDLTGVWGSGASAVWAVGGLGTMLERGP